MEQQTYVLEMRKIGKHFEKNQVLSDVNLKVSPGEIHALLGENGAGKSTLMNILFSMPVIHSTGGFEGEVFFSGEKINLSSPVDAMRIGIGMVHQEFMLIPNYTVTENIKLNREITKHNPVSKVFGESLKTMDFKAMGKDAGAAIGKLKMTIDEWAVVAGLPVGYKQFIEIAREIDKQNIKLLVFDEPTAVLAESEAETLLQAMKEIAAEGIAILFITHRLDEVMSIADNITVLRDGAVVGRKTREETTVYELAEMMVGRKIERIVPPQEDVATEKKTKISIKNLQVHMPGEEVKGLDLDVFEGEILGIGGLAGQGKIGIANGIMGMFPSEGDVIIDGVPLPLNDPRAALERNLVFVSEDRRGIGLLLDLSVEMNIAIPSIQNKNKFIKNYAFVSQIDHKKVRENALNLIKDLEIKCMGPGQVVRRLSGGNQQKVCLAKALTYEPNILFASEPTRGIDVGAKKHILETLIKMNRELGITIIMTSSELAELKSICDRIAIIDEGKIAGILKPTDSDVSFGLLMGGERKIKPDEESK